MSAPLIVGAIHSVRQPGLTFLVPLVDSMVLVDIRETPRTGDKQDVITRDNVTVSVNATIFSQVVDPKLALFSVSNYFIAIDQLSRTTLRAIFGGMSLDDALSQRERINAQLQAQMESVTDKWGIRINRIEIVDITPPQMILNALALQKTADQEKRAFILKSEGQQQSQINIADGQKQAQIKTAEGDKQSAILRAEGLRQATILEAEVAEVYVDPGFRSQGIGGNLLREAVQLFRQRNVTFAAVWTRENNPQAVRLYEEAGFRRTE